MSFIGCVHGEKCPLGLIVQVSNLGWDLAAGFFVRRAPIAQAFKVANRVVTGLLRRYLMSHHHLIVQQSPTPPQPTVRGSVARGAFASRGVADP